MKKTPYTIAVAGKGGSGKTTLAALIISYLLKARKIPVLAVDADPNVNLNEALGLQVDHTVIDTIDETIDRKKDIPAGFTKERFLEYQLNEALVESVGFDLLVMGHTEGPGCYCFANNLLRTLLDRLRSNYPFVIMDNEAGMEHLSRRTTRDVNVLLIVASPTATALRAAKRISDTAGRLKLGIDNIFLVVNSSDRDYDLNVINRIIKDTGLALLGSVPYDEGVLKRSIEAETLLDLNGGSPAARSVKGMMESLGI